MVTICKKWFIYMRSNDIILLNIVIEKGGL